MTHYILGIAILPVLVLICYIYRRDKYQPEPISQLVKGFGWGVLSALITIVIVTPFEMQFGSEEHQNILGCAFDAFCIAAIPEECAKTLCLWLFLRKNKYFDEYMDGIVYAVMVGMGFAAVENVLYLFTNLDEWLQVGLVRGLLSVPGHFFFAVLMGYYFSLWRIKGDSKSFWMMLIAPIMAHGIFDFLLMSLDVSEYLACILLILFFCFLNRLRKYCCRLIESHLVEDKDKIDIGD